MDDVLRSLIEDSIASSGVGHLSLDRILEHGSLDSRAPGNKGSVRAILLGWSPALYPFRVPLLLKKQVDEESRAWNAKAVAKKMAGQRARYLTAQEILRTNAPAPLRRNLDVPLEEARPDVGNVSIWMDTFRHLKALTGSTGGAVRHIEIGVETILRRRERGIMASHPTMVFQSGVYSEQLSYRPGVYSLYGSIIVNPSIHGDVPSDWTKLRGRRLDELVEIPGLEHRIIDNIQERRNEILVRLEQSGPWSMTVSRIIDAERTKPVERAKLRTVEDPAIATTPMVEAAPVAAWTQPSREVAEAMLRGSITTPAQISTLDDDELAAATGADREGVVALRSYARSALNELIAINDGRMVRRF